MRRLALVGAAFAISVLSCGREPAAPQSADGVVYSHGIAFLSEFPAALPAFQAAGGGGVEFTKVRIVLNNPDGSIALDTVVDFPSGETELKLTLAVPLPASAPATGQPLALNLEYKNAAGETVFHGGPVTVNAVPATPGSGPPPPSPVTIPISYTGPGANATAVRITPKSIVVNTGGSFSVSAVAVDAGGTPVPNTPIVFVSKNQTLASVNASTGQGTAGGARGATEIEAQLLTGPTDAASLTILSPPASIVAVSGGGQTAPVKTTLPKPVIVRVLAADGLGAPGVPVTFATPSGGTVGSATENTDADGIAQTTWTLGSAVGTQTLTATVGGLAGSPVTFSATGRSIDPVRLVVAVEPPASTPAGAPLEPAVVINAVDAAGDVTPAFTGPVTVALADGAPAGSLLAGTTTVNAVGGVATFADLSLNKPGTYGLQVSANSLTGAATASFQIVAGPARKLVFQSYPVIGGVAGTPLDAITVVARDEVGNTATSFTGSVTLSLTSAAAALAGGSGHLAMDETKSVNAVAGIATFEGVSIFAAGGYALNAAASGLDGATGPTFGITPGPASSLDVVSGGNQSGSAATALPNPVVIRVADAYGNPISGVTVNFSAVGGGSASPSGAVTDGDGRAKTIWTLGGSAGAQTMSVTSSGLETLVVKATSEGGAAATAGDFIVVHDVNFADNNNGLPNAGNVQFIKNLVNFSISGARSTATRVLLFDFQTFGINYTFTGNWSGAASLIQSQGYTTSQTTNRGDLATVPADVKVLILHLPTGTFSTSEVNGLKAFLAQGGRVLYIGENSSFTYALNAATTLIATMGGSTTASATCSGGGGTVSPHQITTGIADGSFSIACGSIINPGAGDYVLIRNTSGQAIAVVVSVSTTPLPVGGGLREAPANSRTPTKPTPLRPGAPDPTLGTEPLKPPR